MTYIIILTGVPASGGTTVTKQAIKKLGAEGEQFEMVTYSDVMLKEALSRNWVKARDDIRNMNPEKAEGAADNGSENDRRNDNTFYYN